MTEFIALSIVLPTGIVPIIQALHTIQRITPRPDGSCDVDITDGGSLVVAEGFAAFQAALGVVEV